MQKHEMKKSNRIYHPQRLLNSASLPKPPVDVILATTDCNVSTTSPYYKFTKENNDNFLTCVSMSSKHRTSPQAILRNGGTMNITSCVCLMEEDLITAS